MSHPVFQEDIVIDEVAKFLQATYRDYYAVDFLALAEQVDGVFDAMEEAETGSKEKSLDSSVEELRGDDGKGKQRLKSILRLHDVHTKYLRRIFLT